MRKVVTIICLSLAVAGCATPVTMLRNEYTGQVARCGGNVSSSIAGGMIGYGIQLAIDQNCVRDYQEHSFWVVD